MVNLFQKIKAMPFLEESEEWREQQEREYAQTNFIKTMSGRSGMDKERFDRVGWDLVHVDQDNCEAVEALKAYKPGEPGYMLCGKVGTGKTFAVQSMAKSIVTRFNTNFKICNIASIARILAKDQGRETTHHTGYFFEQMAKSQHLIIDELGTLTPNAYFSSFLYELINKRYDAGQPTFFCTNHMPKDLVQVIGEPMADRCRGLTHDKILVFNGKSRR